jgi:hypothetical protein
VVPEDPDRQCAEHTAEHLEGVPAPRRRTRAHVRRERFRRERRRHRHRSKAEEDAGAQDRQHQAGIVDLERPGAEDERPDHVRQEDRLAPVPVHEPPGDEEAGRPQEARGGQVRAGQRDAHADLLLREVGPPERARGNHEEAEERDEADREHGRAERRLPGLEQRRMVQPVAAVVALDRLEPLGLEHGSAAPGDEEQRDQPDQEERPPSE